MTLDCTTPGKVKIDMIDCVKAMIDECPVELKGTVSTPANDHLFKIDRGKNAVSLQTLHTLTSSLV